MSGDLPLPALPVPVIAIGLLLASNRFMTFALHRHLKFKSTTLAKVIPIRWGIALIEYCLMVPANRIGHGHYSGDRADDDLAGHRPVYFHRVFNILPELTADVDSSDRFCRHRLGGVLHLAEMGMSSPTRPAMDKPRKQA